MILVAGIAAVSCWATDTSGRRRELEGDAPPLNLRAFIKEVPADQKLAAGLIRFLNGKGPCPKRDSEESVEDQLLAMGRGIYPLIEAEIDARGLQGRLGEFFKRRDAEPLIVPALFREFYRVGRAKKVERVGRELLDPDEEKWLSEDKSKLRLVWLVEIIRDHGRSAVPYLVLCLKEGRGHAKTLALDLLLNLALLVNPSPSMEAFLERLNEGEGMDVGRVGPKIVDWWEREHAKMNWDPKKWTFTGD
ncbi:MAG: hypothetical protein HYY17_01360 [Planctomycetes bacterium]|nr:hypothetical protein [Planctomycetota bacterium]